MSDNRTLQVPLQSWQRPQLATFGVFNDDARTRAELLWVLKIIDSNYSFNIAVAINVPRQ